MSDLDRPWSPTCAFRLFQCYARQHTLHHTTPPSRKDEVNTRPSAQTPVTPRHFDGVLQLRLLGGPGTCGSLRSCPASVDTSLPGRAQTRTPGRYHTKRLSCDFATQGPVSIPKTHASSSDADDDPVGDPCPSPSTERRPPPTYHLGPTEDDTGPWILAYEFEPRHGFPPSPSISRPVAPTLVQPTHGDPQRSHQAKVGSVLRPRLRRCATLPQPRPRPTVGTDQQPGPPPSR